MSYTIQQGIAEQVQIFGQEKSDQQWISTSWDTWERNPYYKGVDQPHPEEYPACGTKYSEYFAEQGWEVEGCGCRCKDCDPVAYEQDEAEYQKYLKDNCPF